MRTRYTVAVYDVNLARGGAEEGGWWYPEGSLLRVSRVFGSEAMAEAFSRRLNARLDYLQRDRRPLSSVLSDGRAEAYVFEGTAPEGFPNQRPVYE